VGMCVNAIHLCVILMGENLAGILVLGDAEADQEGSVGARRGLGSLPEKFFLLQMAFW